MNRYAEPDALHPARCRWSGFVVLGLFGRALPRVAISVIGCGVVLVGLRAVALADFITMLGVAPDAARLGDVHALDVGHLRQPRISRSACSPTRSRR